jgi:AcrR family transcriptional regulator
MQGDMATPPQQARSIATEKKMLDAAEELLVAGDARNVTVENVVKKSGATVGSFYARFGNIEGLFDALHKRYIDAIYESTLFEALTKAVEQPNLRLALHHASKTMLEFGLSRRKILFYFITQETTGGLEVRQHSVNNVHEILKAHRSEIVHKDLRRASDNTARLIYQMFVGVILLEPSEFSGRKTSLSSLIDTTTQMAFNYLTCE